MSDQRGTDARRTPRRMDLVGTWCLLLVVVIGTVLPVDAEPSLKEIEDSLRDNLRRSSAASENIVAVLNSVERLLERSAEESNKTDRILRNGQDVIGTSLNVSEAVSEIRDKLQVLDGLLKTSQGHSAALKSVQASMKEMTSEVRGVSNGLTDCNAATAKRFEGFSTSMSQKLKDVVEQHCDVSSTVEETLKRAADSETNTSSLALQHLEGLTRKIDDIAVAIAQFKNDTDIKLQQLRGAIDRQRVEEEAWRKTARAMGTRREKAYWHSTRVYDAIETWKNKHTEVHHISGELTVGGYTGRFRIGLTPVDGEAWFGLFFTLCPGEKDEFLRWPFMTPFKLSFVHPTNSSRDLGFEVPKSLLADGSSRPLVQKPAGKCNEGTVGFPQIGKADTMKMNGYKLNDGLTVSIELYPDV